MVASLPALNSTIDAGAARLRSWGSHASSLLRGSLHSLNRGSTTHPSSPPTSHDHKLSSSTLSTSDSAPFGLDPKGANGGVTIEKTTEFDVRSDTRSEDEVEIYKQNAGVDVESQRYVTTCHGASGYY